MAPKHRYNLSRHRSEDGFTLVELLVAIIIIGILAAIAFAVFSNQQKKGIDATVQSDLRNAAVQVTLWDADKGGKGTPLPNMSDSAVKSDSTNSDLADMKVSDKGTQLYFYGDAARFCISGINPNGDVANATISGATTPSEEPAHNTTHAMVDSVAGNYSGISLRQTPGGTNIKAVNNGVVVKYTGNVSGTWVEINNDGIVGWVNNASGWLKSTYHTRTLNYRISPDAPPAPGGINLRSGPGISNPAYKAISSSTPINATGRTAFGPGGSGTWVEVYNSTYRGWVDKAWVLPIHHTTPPLQEPAAPAGAGSGGGSEGYMYSSTQGGLKVGLCSGTPVFALDRNGFKAP